MDGEGSNKDMAAFRAAQAKIASEPQLQGTLGYVHTAPFWYAKLDELPRKLQAEERRVKQALAAQFKDRPEASDRKQMEGLINAAFEKAKKIDRGFQQVQQEHDRAVSHWECHYYGSARVYCLVGNGLAEAMKTLLQQR